MRPEYVMSSFFGNTFKNFGKKAVEYAPMALSLLSGGVIGGAAPGVAGQAWSAAAQSQANTAQQAQAKDAMRFEAGQAGIARDWSERMSSTAHQRSVQDLRAAGLNPMLAINAGASTPASAMARGQQAQIKSIAPDASRNLQNAAMSSTLMKTEKTKQALNLASSARALLEIEGRRPDVAIDKSKFGRWFLSPIKRTLSAFSSLLGPATKVFGGR